MTGLDMHLAPLRNRTEEMPALIALFLSKKGITLEDEVFNSLALKLQSFYWAGNIRQLFKALDAWILTCEFDNVPLVSENFPIFKGMQKQSVEVQLNSETTIDILQSANKDQDFEEVMAQYEKVVISNALKRHGSVVSVCRAMNIPRSTLDTKRRKYGLI